MRKIFAAFLIFLSLISYSQGQNRFSEEQDVVSESSSSNKQYKQDPEQQNNTAAKGMICPNGNDQDVDCDCDGILDVNEPDPEDVCGGPNPSEPVPINDYIPILMIIAIGIIVYKTQQKKNLLS